MPLSVASQRKPLHKRRLTFQAYQRDDGLFDIEGHLIDSKSYDIVNADRGGVIATGEALHEMLVRVTIDDTMLIHHAEASTEWAPFHYCKSANHSFSRLVGETIGKGWNRKVRSLLGSTEGCTHIYEMLGQLATTAFQAVSFKSANHQDTTSKHKPAILDTCYALASTSPVVAREWPEHYTGD